MIAIAPVRLCAAVFCALALAMAGPQALAQQRVGVDSAVNPDAAGALPGAQLKRLVLGEDVIFKERIVTQAAGQTQILFVDESSMTIGPNSDMVIDEFVFDPNAGTGKLAASLTRGVFRFVGGRLSKQPNAITMQTPSATIGIRGGVFLLDIGPNGAMNVIFVFGQSLSVTGLNGNIVTMTRPGFQVTVPAPGASPLPPVPAPRQTTATLLAALDGRPGGNGGARNVPTDTTVANSGISNDISGNLPASVQQAAQRTQVAFGQPRTTDVATLSTSQQQQITSSQSQSVVVQSTQSTPGSTISGGTGGGVSAQATARGGRFFSTGTSGTAAGFPDQGQPFDNWTLTNGILTATPSGAGTVQFPLAAGTTTFGPGGTSSPLGPVSGTAFLSPDGTFFFANLSPVNQPNQREFIVGGQGVDPAFYSPTGVERFFAFNVQPDAALQSPVPFIRNQTGGSIPNPSVSQLYLTSPANDPFPGPISGGVLGKSLQASLAINGQGADQSSVIVVSVGNPLNTQPQPTLAGTVQGSFMANGTAAPVKIAGSLMSTTDGNGNSFYGTSQISGFAVGGSPSETTLGAAPSSSGYNFVHAVSAAALPSGVGTSTTSQTLTGFFGGVMTKQGASPVPYAVTGTTSITTDAPNLRIAATFNGSDPFTASTSGINSLVLQYGNLSPGTNAAQAYIDDNLFATLQSPPFAGVPQTTVNGASADNAQTYLVSSGTVPSTALLPAGASLCQCQFLKWGYWGGEVDSTPAGGPSRIDYAHINMWLAGSPTPLTDLAQLAGTGFQGTYNGTLMGTVFNNGAQYLAAGGLQATYNFAARTGTIAVSNYDGITIPPTALSNGTIQANGNYAFTFAGGGLAGQVNGGFYGPMAAETGGNFALQKTAGPPYFTSGIFAAKR